MEDELIHNPQERLEKDLKYIKDTLPRSKPYYPKWVNDKRFGYFPVVLSSRLNCCLACVFGEGEHSCDKEGENKKAD